MKLQPNHFYYPVDVNWDRIITFLPLFEFAEAHEMNCKECHLDSYVHPLVQDEKDKHCFHKLCTAQVIRAGLLNIKTVFLDHGGCCQDRLSDYAWAMEKFNKNRTRKQNEI